MSIKMRIGEIVSVAKSSDDNVSHCFDIAVMVLICKGEAQTCPQCGKEIP